LREVEHRWSSIRCESERQLRDLVLRQVRRFGECQKIRGVRLRSPEIVGPTCGIVQDVVRIDDADHRVVPHAVPEHGIGKHVDDAARIGYAARLDHDLIGFRLLCQDDLERSQQVALQRAADASVPQADHQIGTVRD
jgi:hypothetical protein